MRKEVVDRFQDLADQRTEDHRTDEDPLLPFHPLGTLRNENPKNEKDLTFRLKTGDLVNFRPTEDGEEIGEISLSAIWRGRVDQSHELTAMKASTHAFFGAIDKELLPFNGEREIITIAEQLFGFVQQDEREHEDRNSRTHSDSKESLALAPRLRFSHATLEGFM